jgi:hypothetical protein
MDVLATLKTSREQLLTALLAATLNPSPNYTIEGQTVGFKDYLQMLIEGIKEINGLILLFEPYQITSVVP